MIAFGFGSYYFEEEIDGKFQGFWEEQPGKERRETGDGTFVMGPLGARRSVVE